MDDTDRAMDDFKIELFIFPDGTAVEMMVFDHQGPGSGHPAPSASASERADRRGGVGAGGRALRVAALHRSARPRRARRDARSTPTSARSATATSCTPSTGSASATRSGSSGSAAPSARPSAPSRWAVPQVEQLNRELYHGTQALAREAERVSRQNFEDEARRFVAALQRGDIEPIDF